MDLNISNSTTASVPVKLNYTTYVPVTTIISSALSILGSIGIFWIIKNEQKRTYTLKLIIFLTIADLINAVGNLSGAVRYLVLYNGLVSIHKTSQTCTDTEDFVCVAQSFVTIFATISSFFWTFFVTLHHFLMFVKNESLLKRKACQIIEHACAWLIPVTVAIIAASAGVLGEGYSVCSGPWCWIRDCPELFGQSTTPIGWMAITGKAWEIAAYIATCLLYIFLKFQHMRKLRTNRDNSIQSSILTRSESSESEIKSFGILWLVLYLYVTRCWGTLRYLMAAVRLSSDSFQNSHRQLLFDNADKVLVYFQSIGDSLQAFVNFLLLLCTFRCNICNNTNRDSGHAEHGELTERSSLVWRST